jgi:hypothetical protein
MTTPSFEFLHNLDPFGRRAKENEHESLMQLPVGPFVAHFQVERILAVAARLWKRCIADAAGLRLE